MPLTPSILNIVVSHRRHHCQLIVSFDANNHPHLATFFSLCPSFLPFSLLTHASTFHSQSTTPLPPMAVIVGTPTIPDIATPHRRHHYWSIVSFDADNHPHLATFFSLSIPHSYHFPLLPMPPLLIHSQLHHRLPWPSL